MPVFLFVSSLAFFNRVMLKLQAVDVASKRFELSFQLFPLR